jgi:RES domain-containing protein
MSVTHNSTSSLRDYACVNCFRDERLVEWMRRNGSPGNCGWCGKLDTIVVPLPLLGSEFRTVASVYEPTSYGESLGYLFEQDWDLFGLVVSANTSMRDELTTAILEAGLHPNDDPDAPDYRGTFERDESDTADEWDAHIEYIMGQRPEPPEYSDFVGERWSPLNLAIEDAITTVPAGAVLYRARLHEERSRFERYRPSEMGAPPPIKARGLRANRQGKPALYLASDAATAIAEIRGWRGAAVALAQFETKRDLRIVDLVSLRKIASPFFDESLSWKLDLFGILNRLAEELSRPVLPGEEGKLYGATQYFSELVNRAGFDGIAYPSSLSELGTNTVLFDVWAARATSVRYIRILKVSHTEEEIPEEAQLYDALSWGYGG